MTDARISPETVDALMPCPFCGEERIFLNEPNKSSNYGSINCPACLAIMPGECSDQTELIAAWNQRSVDVAQWQDISTAPKDGRCDLWVVYYDAYQSHGRRYTDAQYREHQASWFDAYGNKLDWSELDETDDMKLRGSKTTHWMPVPGAPALSSTDRETDDAQAPPVRDVSEKTECGQWIDQNYQIDRYGVALMMIGAGCADPAGLARRILSEFGCNPSNKDK